MIRAKHDRAIGDFTGPSNSVRNKPGLCRARLCTHAQGDADGALADYARAVELNPAVFWPFTIELSPESKRAILMDDRRLYQTLGIDPTMLTPVTNAALYVAPEVIWMGRSPISPKHRTESSAREAYANRGIIMLLRGQDAAAQKEFDTALKIENTSTLSCRTN